MATLMNMATRNVIESDLSGKVNASTVTFGLNGSWYEIDLTQDEQEQLEKVLQTYVASGRKTLAKDTLRKRQVPETTPEEREEIRAWAINEGYDLAQRGRIPKKIMRAYDEAHGLERRLPDIP